jgi:hypothetical protein
MPSPGGGGGMGQAEGQLAIIAQRIKTHDPGLRPAIDSALIAYDEKLLLGMKRFDSRETIGNFW